MSAELYHDELLALAKDKARTGRLDRPDGTARSDNPLCGDRVTIDIQTHGQTIAQITHKTRGCILTQAAASMIVRHAQGVELENVREFTVQATRFLKGDDDASQWPEMTHFTPVREVTSRHDCILIAFKALEAATLDAQSKE